MTLRRLIMMSAAVIGVIALHKVFHQSLLETLRGIWKEVRALSKGRPPRAIANILGLAVSALLMMGYFLFNGVKEVVLFAGGASEADRFSEGLFGFCFFLFIAAMLLCVIFVSKTSGWSDGD